MNAGERREGGGNEMKWKKKKEKEMITFPEEVLNPKFRYTFLLLQNREIFDYWYTYFDVKFLEFTRGQ